MKPSNFRFLNSDDYDVDAFWLTNETWLLFVYLKRHQILEKNPNFFKSLAIDFSSKNENARVSLVGGALKIDGESKPLKSLVFEDSSNWCFEGDLRFKLEVENVLNPGLFIDQRENRKTLIEMIKKSEQVESLTDADSFLNLFSFTGAFSMAAISAGVKNSTSVDVSSRYLNWERENFRANFSDTENIRHRTICEDAREFLKREQRRAATYRWIVVDPPTFSRGAKKGGKIFKVQDDFFPMLEQVLGCLLKKKGSAILASNNDARWRLKDFFKEVAAFAKSNGLDFRHGVVPSDFGPEHPLKSAWLIYS